MKKLLKILVISILAVVCSLGVVACDAPGAGDKEPGFKMYLVQNDGDPYYVISEYVDDGETDVLSVPSKNGEYPVKEIKSNAFKNNETVTELIVPDSIETINEGAFAGMKKLSKITLPFIGKTAVSDSFIGETDEAANKSIDKERTFAYLFGTESFNYGVQITGKYNSGDSNTKNYYMPSSLKEVTISSSKAYGIPMYAFSGNTVIETINLVGNIDMIGDYAFDGMKKLSKITVLGTVNYIGNYAFNGCSALTDNGFAFADGTADLVIGEHAFDGVGLEVVKLPARVKTLGDYAFANSTVLDVELSLNKVSNYAFYNCTNLASVKILGTTEIGVYAFANCKNLTKFGGNNAVDNVFDLTGITKLGAMSFANLNKTVSVTSTLAIDVINSAFFNTTIA